LFRGARVLTLRDRSGEDARGARRGGAMRDLGVLARANVLVAGGRVARVAESIDQESIEKVRVDTRAHEIPLRVVECAGRVLMPAFTDCHTHACWAGDRLDEWEMRLRGAAYLDILKAGGGIMSSVRSVRASSEDELADALLARLITMLRTGTTCVEVKSGYGLTTHDELKMLRAIRNAAARWPGRVAMTACIGHAIDPDEDRARFVERTIGETLDAVHAEFPGIAIDAYAESGAWNRDECLRLFERAGGLGHPVRVHADQFTSLGMVRDACERGWLSVDHLEASTPEDRARLGAKRPGDAPPPFAVVLPCSGFHTDRRYADARALIDAGAAVCVATNLNPGSAPCPSVAMAIALAVRFCGMTPAEAIVASVRNSAALLAAQGGWPDDAGRIEPGSRADLVLLDQLDEREVAHSFGDSPVRMVVCAGEVVSERSGISTRSG
jgi:imidazolonepropionase